MKNLREEYQELKYKVETEYRKRVDKIGTIIFFEEGEESDEEELFDCELITLINNHGENIDAYVLSIDKESGIYVAKCNSESTRFWISLNDLSSLYDKITVIELLER